MADGRVKVVVLALDASSGAVREGEDGPVGLDLWPETEQALDAAREAGVKTMLAVPTERGAEDREALLGWSEGSDLVALPLRAAQGGFDGAGFDGAGFEKMKGAALVSSDRRMREDAAQAGMVPVPHVALVPMLARGADVKAARMTGTRDALRRFAVKAELLAMHFQPVPGSRDWALIALMDAEAAADAVMAGISYQPLDYDPMVEDLVWQRLEDEHDARAMIKRRRVLHSEPGQVLLALGPGESAEDLGVHGAHGHTEFLMPDPNLMRAPVVAETGFRAPDLERFPRELLDPVDRERLERLVLAASLPACSTVTAHYEADLDRYTGVTALNSGGVVASRHIAHPDNQRVESQLLADLNAMGYCAFRHNFSHAGNTHSNIIADLPGTGYLRLKPWVLEKVRKVLIREPLQFKDWQREMEALKLADWFREGDFHRMEPRELRLRIEDIFQLKPWAPWWLKLCEVAGYGAGILVVGCHLDSTAANDGGYNPATGGAPGRDDNGSGLAAVLSMARYLRGHMKGKLTHTVRFAFFNAEEHGLIGSKAYASALKAVNAPLRGAICMDMMGYNSDSNRLFEVHAGYTDPAVRDLSVPMADTVASSAAAYGALAPAQIYKGTSSSPSAAPDRDVYDGGINRSDHAAFHQQGWPAVLISEDFFANLGTEPGADPNPNYHRLADAVVDVSYAKDIVCAATKAVMTLAN